MNEIDRNADGKISILEWILWAFDVAKSVITAILTEEKEKKGNK